MTLKQNKLVYFDQNQAAIISNTGGTTVSALPSPTMWLNNEYDMDIIIYEVFDTRFDASAGTTFKLGIGTPGASEVLVNTNNASIISTSANLGEFTAAINTTSATLEADLGTAEVKSYVCELVADEDSVIAQFPCFIKNVVYDE